MRTEEQAFHLISDWHNVSIGKKIETNDVFFLFMASWVSLNALYNWYGKKANLSGDKKKLRRFADANEKAKNIHKQLFSGQVSYKSAVETLAEKGILDVSKGQRVLITDETNFEQVILCVYQVRNNLFHGDKLLANERDKEVVSASYIIVSNFLKEYLNNSQTDLFGMKSQKTH
jgi:hypothetical protein